MSIIFDYIDNIIAELINIIVDKSIHIISSQQFIIDNMEAVKDFPSNDLIDHYNTKIRQKMKGYFLYIGKDFVAFETVDKQLFEDEFGFETVNLSHVRQIHNITLYFKQNDSCFITTFIKGLQNDKSI